MSSYDLLYLLVLDNALFCCPHANWAGQAFQGHSIPKILANGIWMGHRNFKEKMYRSCYEGNYMTRQGPLNKSTDHHVSLNFKKNPCLLSHRFPCRMSPLTSYGAFSLYSTAMQKHWRWAVALGNTPNARVYRWGYQHIGI